MAHGRRVLIAAVLLTAIGTAGCWRPAGSTPKQQRAAVLEMRDDTLRDLYALSPAAKKNIQGAVGYAVFSNYNLKILLIGTGQGYGVAVDNKTKKQTFMRMAQGGAGLGAGFKDFRVVFVFTQREAFDSFVNNGFQMGGQLGAAAKYEDRGGAGAVAIPIAPGVRAYQITESGLMAEAMLMGSKFWKDDDLN